MSLYQLQKLMFQTRSDVECRHQYLRDRTAFVARYGLTEAERQAVVDVDIRALYVAGIHPLLLLPFVELNGVNPKDYYAALTGLD